MWFGCWQQIDGDDLAHFLTFAQVGNPPPQPERLRHRMPAPSYLQAAHASPAEALAGLVERVTYHNEESGFCVLRVKARGQRDLITIVGHAASISSEKSLLGGADGPADFRACPFHASLVARVAV